MRSKGVQRSESKEKMYTSVRGRSNRRRKGQSWRWLAEMGKNNLPTKDGGTVKNYKIRKRQQRQIVGLSTTTYHYLEAIERICSFSTGKWTEKANLLDNICVSIGTCRRQRSTEAKVNAVWVWVGRSQRLKNRSILVAGGEGSKWRASTLAEWLQYARCDALRPFSSVVQDHRSTSRSHINSCHQREYWYSVVSLKSSEREVQTDCLANKLFQLLPPATRSALGANCKCPCDLKKSLESDLYWKTRLTLRFTGHSPLSQSTFLLGKVTQQ